MNQDQAIEAAKDFGVEPGDTVTVQSDGQVQHPHDSGSGMHTDGWAVTHNSDGTWDAEKLHTPY